jgi:DNA-binding NarL/FixJ family response regulator
MKKSAMIIAEHKMAGEFLITFLQDKFKDITFFNSTSINDARDILQSVSFDLILTDILALDNSVISTIKYISLLSPKTSCLLLSPEVNIAWVDRALRAGARGFISKTCACDEIVNAVNAAIQGRNYLSPDVIQRLSEHLVNGKCSPPHTTLSPREFEIFVYLGQGKSLKNISADLKLSSNTVAVHKHNISLKTGIKSTAKIAHYCIEHGLLRSAA